MANGRGMKLGNGYIGYLGHHYADTPKAVFAAIAFSLSFIDVEERGEKEAVAHLLNEWRVLHENGIVPQKPPKEAYAVQEVL